MPETIGGSCATLLLGCIRQMKNVASDPHSGGRNFANHLRAVIDGTEPDPASLDYPKIEDGIRGMAFIEAVVESSNHNARWTSLEGR